MPRRTELKFRDTQRGDITFNTLWEPKQVILEGCLSAVPLEATESGRVGRVYYIHSIHVKCELFFDPLLNRTVVTPETYVRMSLILDKQTNGAEMDGFDCYDESGSKNWIGFRNLQFTQRFQVLQTKTFTLTPPLVAQGVANKFASGILQKNVDFNYVFETPLKVHCSGDTATVASITDNSIHMFGVASNNIPQCSFQSRIRFTD